VLAIARPTAPASFSFSLSLSSLLLVASSRLLGLFPRPPAAPSRPRDRAPPASPCYAQQHNSTPCFRVTTPPHKKRKKKHLFFVAAPRCGARPPQAESTEQRDRPTREENGLRASAAALFSRQGGSFLVAPPFHPPSPLAPFNPTPMKSATYHKCVRLWNPIRKRHAIPRSAAPLAVFSCRFFSPGVFSAPSFVWRAPPPPHTFCPLPFITDPHERPCPQTPTRAHVESERGERARGARARRAAAERAREERTRRASGPSPAPPLP